MLTMSWMMVSVFGLVLLIGSIYAENYHHPRVVGGHDTTIKRFPYLVSIRVFGGHNCGGTIISDRHILTAAHCMYEVEKDDLEDISVYSGTSDSATENGYKHMIQSVHIHPKFNMTNEAEGYPHDIAVLTLNDTITFDKYQKQINLPSYNVQEYQVAHLVGWGLTKKHNWNSSKQLQTLRVVMLPSDKCKPLMQHKINPEQLCAIRSAKTGACHGDSGGPLIRKNEVVGIVSYGDTGICANAVPDIYTNVFAYKDFIKSIMNEES